MKKHLLALLFAALATPLLADNHLSTTVTLASNYIYRAMSYNSQGAVYQSQGSPVIQASMDFVHNLSNTAFSNINDTLAASFFTGPADTYNTVSTNMEKDTEEDTFLTYNKSVTSDLTVGLGYNYYAFGKNVNNDMGEWAVTGSYKTLSFLSSYIDNFSGVDTNYNHTILTWKPTITDKLGLDLHMAHTYFKNPAAVATTSYYDYQAGLVANVDGFTTEIAYTNTFGRTNLVTGQYAMQDGTFTVTLSKTFSIL